MKKIKSVISIGLIFLMFCGTVNVFGINKTNTDAAFSEDNSTNKKQFESYLLNKIYAITVEIENYSILTVYFSNPPIEYYFKNLITIRAIELSYQKMILKQLYICKNIDINFTKTDIIFPFHNFL